MSDQSSFEAQSPIVAPAPSWQALRIAAEIYADFQQFRIAATNRAERGGVPPEEFEGLLEGLSGQENVLKKDLQARYRAAVPERLRTWQAETKGLGEHTFARLLGLLGDPLMAHPWHWEGKGRAERHLVPDPPYERTVGQLWAYCGVGDSSRRRKSGMDVEDALACGSPRLRALLFVIAEGCMKNRQSPYRRIYDDRRAVTAEREHAAPCVRCGRTGHPAEAGTPWKDAHKHADALRIVAKEVLRDLWLTAGEGAISESRPKTPTPLPAVGQSANRVAKPIVPSPTGD